jgi:multidrug efflux system membrane fusion protein
MTKSSGTILVGEGRPEGRGAGTEPRTKLSGTILVGEGRPGGRGAGTEPRARGSSPLRRWLVAGISIVALGAAWLAWSHHRGEAVANNKPAALPKVFVNRPVVRSLDARLGFLGQFSAVERVELRAQVGGTLTGIHFKDGDIVRRGDLLFSIDPGPYEIRLAETKAQLESATARLDLANRERDRAAKLLEAHAISREEFDTRSADQHTAQAAIDAANAQIRDAEFDLGHCRIVAPFTGRIGTHLVSVGNLIAGSRAATSPTTLLATLVSLDPIYLDFDMSESDYLAFSRERAKLERSLADRVELELSDETQFNRQGKLDFVDNVLDRSSGTLHARATVPNPGLLLTPGEFARVRLSLGAPAPHMLIPDAAVLPDQSGHLVLTVSAEGTVVPKQVEIGDLRDGLRVIRSGLKADDRIIVDGLPYATPGSKVEAQERKDDKDTAERYAATASQSQDK